MYILVLVVHIIASLVLVAVILLQAGKGGGLADTFGGGGGSQTTVFGTKMSTFLTRATSVSAILFLCTSLSLAFLSSKKQKSLMEGVKFAPVAAGEQAGLPSAQTAEKAAQAVTETAQTAAQAPVEAAKEVPPQNIPGVVDNTQGPVNTQPEQE